MKGMIYYLNDDKGNRITMFPKYSKVRLEFIVQRKKLFKYILRRYTSHGYYIKIALLFRFYPTIPIKIKYPNNIINLKIKASITEFMDKKNL